MCFCLNLKKFYFPCKVNSSRGHGFGIRPVHRLSWLRVFVVLLSRKNAGIVPLRGDDRFLPTPFQFVMPSLTLPFDSSYWHLRCYSDGLRDGRSGFDSRLRQEIFLISQRPDRFWGPPSVLFNVYGGTFLGGKAAVTWSVPLNLRLVLRWRIVEVYLRSPIYLHGTVLN
jgi:hypothetical protein